jgi:hypothetical protein
MLQARLGRVSSDSLRTMAGDDDRPSSSSSRVRRPSAVGDTFRAAAGRYHRDDPVASGSGGPAGNARLTAWTGLLLLVLSLAELVTLINVGGLISWHIAIGVLLVPPALLKTASTGWRIARYYSGNSEYRRAGPPPMPLRILGPGVVLSTLGLLASGLMLILLGRSRSRSVLFTVLGQRVDWLTVHQGLFIVWAVLTGLHVLGRTVPALQLTLLRNHTAKTVDGTRRRRAVLIGTVMVAGLAAVLVLSASGSWKHGEHHQPRNSPNSRSTTALGDRFLLTAMRLCRLPATMV